MPSDARIISRAIVTNTPAYPKRLPIVLIATPATLMLSAGSIASGELLRMTAPRASVAAAPRATAEPMFVDGAAVHVGFGAAQNRRSRLRRKPSRHLRRCRHRPRIPISLRR